MCCNILSADKKTTSHCRFKRFSFVGCGLLVISPVFSIMLANLMNGNMSLRERFEKKVGKELEVILAKQRLLINLAQEMIQNYYATTKDESCPDIFYESAKIFN